jgi:hypothetical protein
MFVHTALLHDARVEREAAALAAAGYDVRVVAARGAGTPARERRDGFEIERVDSDPMPTRAVRRALAARGRGGDIGTVAAPLHRGRAGVRGVVERLALRVHLAAELARYVRLAAGAAKTAPAQVWMAHDLDALPAAWFARRRHGGRLLYDSHELFSERIAVSSAARPFWRALERRLARRADAVVTVGDGVAAELARRYRLPAPTVVRNIPAAGPAAVGDGSGSRWRLGSRSTSAACSPVAASRCWSTSPRGCRTATWSSSWDPATRTTSPVFANGPRAPARRSASCSRRRCRSRRSSAGRPAPTSGWP